MQCLHQEVIPRHQMSMVMMMTMMTVMVMVVVDDTVVVDEVASVSASLLLRATHHQILVRLRDSLRVFAVAGFAQILDAPLHLGLSAWHVLFLAKVAEPTVVQPVVQPLLLLVLDMEVAAVLVTLVVVCVADHHEQPLVGPLRLVLDDVARSLAVPPQPAVRLLLLALVPVVVAYIHKSVDVRTKQ